jgi:hypothetical protein
VLRAVVRRVGVGVGLCMYVEWYDVGGSVVGSCEDGEGVELFMYVFFY